MASPKVWLVTGCSSGFGEQFIKSIIARGDKAIATARKLDSIIHLAEIGAAILQLDLDSPSELFDEVVRQAWVVYGHIDVLVQNAGNTYIAAVEDLGEGRIEKIYQANVFGTMHLTNAITPYFRSQNSGFVLLISSGASSLIFPGFGGYGSSKAAIENLTRAYAEEVKSIGIKTLILSPGTYRTGIRDLSRHRQDFPENSKNYQWMTDMYVKMFEQTHGTQNGDPRKFVELAIDLVRGEGAVKGKEVPLALPVGADCVPGIRAKLEEELRVLKEWEDVVSNTDFDGMTQVGDALMDKKA